MVVTPPPATADPVPLAFDFIDEVAQPATAKTSAAKSKLSAVVSVPKSQAKAAKKPDK